MAEKQTVVEEENIFTMIPAVELSEDVVYSPTGDMRAALPVRWVALDAASFGNPDIFAVACDPDYSMTVVFSEIEMDQSLTRAYAAGGMMGLLKENFDDRSSRISGATATLVSAEEFAIGRRRFASYSFTTDTGFTTTRVALFYTRQHLYECAISPLPYSESELPTNERMEEIHQIILGGIEW